VYYEQGPGHEPRWWEELWAVLSAVMGVLFWPLVVLIGFIVWVMLTIAAFSTHWLLGLLCLGVAAVAIALFAYWDSHRPPQIQS
jgi:cell division protein FtsW (lipid II flippase)